MKIFISYSWKNYQVADKVEFFFRQKKDVELFRDARYMTYKSNIKEFMEKIRDADYALTVVSDEYLKSENCMYEILELYKDKNVENKILPLVVDGATIYDTRGRSNYLKYWAILFQEQTFMLKEIPFEKGVEARKELSILSDILGHIDTFTSYISRRKHVRWNYETGTCNFDEIADFINL